MTLELEATKRELLGRKVKDLRAKGIIPAELYGNKVENVHLSLREGDFMEVYKEGGENTVIKIQFDGQTKPVLIHDVQLDPVTDKVLAVDLYEVDMTKKVTTQIPLEFVGESPAVEEQGGILNKALDEIEVEALPTNIPHSIRVDISVLGDFSKSIHVSDLKSTGDFEIKTEIGELVVGISEPREEEEPEAETSVEDITVEGEEDKEGEASAEDSSPSKSGEDKESNEEAS